MLFPIMFPQVPSKHDGHDVWQRSCCWWVCLGELVTLAHIYFISILPLNFLWNCTVYLRTRRHTDSRSLSLRCCISVVGGFKQNLSDHLFTALESQLQVMRRQMVRGPLQAALTLIYCNWTGWFRWWTASAGDCRPYWESVFPDVWEYRGYTL